MHSPSKWGFKPGTVLLGENSSLRTRHDDSQLKSKTDIV